MKKIFIGIDVSKEKLDATAIKSEKATSGIVQLDYQVFENSISGFKKMAAWADGLQEDTEPDDLLFCCEATGGYDHRLCDYLYTNGLDIWREGALQIKLSSGVRKCKNDKADSRTIAEYAMRHTDKLRVYHPLNQTVVELRLLLLERRRLEEEKKAIKVRANEMKATHIESKALTEIYNDSMEQVANLEERIAKFEKMIMETIKSDEDVYRNYKHLISIKSIGLVNATTFITFTNNFKDFPTARKMASFWGVASFMETSGTSVKKKANVRHLSNPMLKEYLTQAAECAIRPGGIFREYSLRLTQKGKIYGVMINNVRNKLIHLAFTLVKNNQDYEYNHEFAKSIRTQLSA